MVLPEDSLTRGEQTLLEHGRTDEVLRLRRTFQELMGDELSAGVAELTGRPVVAFLRANDADPDPAAEIFVLGPAADGVRGAPARAGGQGDGTATAA